MQYSFTFHYDRRGHGDLVLRKDGDRHREWTSRCGSIDTSGKLKNATPPGIWKILEPPVFTNEPAMVVGGIGWKVRLYTAAGEFTRYLIHPDGNLPGSLGCIVLIGTAGLPLKETIAEILKDQQMILVDVARSKTA